VADYERWQGQSRRTGAVWAPFFAGAGDDEVKHASLMPVGEMVRVGRPATEIERTCSLSRRGVAAHRRG
jgi:hypothetical protein